MKSYRLPGAPGNPRTCEQQPATEEERLTPAEEEVFSDFYRGFIKPLVRFLVWKGVPLADAAEAAQEAMIDALRQWRSIVTPEAWVRLVASRKAIRKLASVEEVPAKDLAEVSPLLRVTPDGAVRWAEEQTVLRMLDELPARQRQVMAWTYDGYKPAEIAELLQLDPAAVRGNLRKARRALAARFDGEEGEQ
ncbi:RNA polymerase sigma factor [Micromonospora ureilytica]|uniref:RNA polymerase sigma factor n=1 Tax=Micromonospora ureilytica TaxID=709868 RepID=UPI00142E4837|nr:sigma-70 family RNA polymerase sigma factor [Micromonospora ureilytica]